MMEPGSHHAREVLSGIDGPRALSWSPDGQWLVFSGSIEGAEGLWLWRASDQKLVQVAAGAMFHPAWSPDSTRIVVAKDTGQLIRGLALSRLIVFDIGSIASAGPR
jgi:Tol biopolymer transport system component